MIKGCFRGRWKRIDPKSTQHYPGTLLLRGKYFAKKLLNRFIPAYDTAQATGCWMSSSMFLPLGAPQGQVLWRYSVPPLVSKHLFNLGIEWILLSQDLGLLELQFLPETIC
jgi:hypothetical protein